MVEPHLTAREKQLLYLVAEEGLAYKEIAYRMHIAERRVRQLAWAIGKRLGLAAGQPQLHMTIWYWRRRLREEVP